ncbi:hypothetical protein [Halomontanus rarus]|uniref:hypothetical protein n=1 Tax=Halomontanus rarus TaxID=3034020 RepID=UPI00307C0401
MSDGDRFDAFDELEDDEDDAEPDPTPDVDHSPSPDRETPAADRDTTDDVDDPAFSYADSNQGPIYARPETWDAIDDTLELEVERYLREKDVRNTQKRELHDAVLRLAVEEPERVAELVLEARRG